MKWKRPKGTLRPRLCRACHAPATCREVEQRPAAVLHLDGTVRRFTKTVSVYWCDHHTAIGGTP